MDELLTALAPGLMVALVPTLLTISYQLSAARRDRVRQRSERLISLLLDLRSEAEAMTYQGAFADAHLYAVGKASNSPAIILGHLPTFDLAGMSRELTGHLSRIHRLANELTAITEKEATHLAVKRAVDSTMDLLHAYMAPDDARPKLLKLLSSRPPLDLAMVAVRTSAFELAFRELTNALSSRSRTRWGRRTWP